MASNEIDVGFARALHQFHARLSLGEKLVNGLRSVTGETPYFFVDKNDQHCLIIDTYDMEATLTTDHPVEVYENPEMQQVWVGDNEKHRLRIFVVRAPAHPAYKPGAMAGGPAFAYDSDNPAPYTALRPAQIPQGRYSEVTSGAYIPSGYSPYGMLTDPENKVTIFVLGDPWGGVDMQVIVDGDATPSNIEEALKVAVSNNFETLYYEPPPIPDIASEDIVKAFVELGAVPVQATRSPLVPTNTYTVYVISNI